MDKLSGILMNLDQSNDRCSALQSIKPALSALTRQELVDGLKDVSLLPIFDCLKTNDVRLIDAACDILQHLLNFIDPVFVIEKYEQIHTFM